MSPKRIILVRHGESLGNVDVSAFDRMPDYKIPLTERGIEQSRELGKTLNQVIPPHERVRLYCSPYERTKQTLEFAREKFRRYLAALEFDPRIREREWVDWVGVHENIPRDRAYNFWYRMPGGESCADVYNRISSFVESLYRDLEKDDAENILIFSHGTAMRVFMMRWLKLEVEDFYRIQNPKNCGLIILEKDKDGKYPLKTELEKARKGTVV